MEPRTVRPLVALVTAVSLTLLAYGVLLREIGPTPERDAPSAAECAPDGSPVRDRATHRTT